MTFDWRRHRAVVLESDDWGLCAWSADDQAHRALCRTPAFRDAVGERYGRSTLESADDVRRLCAVLEEFRDRDGIAPIWQANTVMASPDFARLAAGGFERGKLPVVHFPHTPPRWNRPGLWEAIQSAMGRGVWWPELHGLLHVPVEAWRLALQRGDPDARLALEQECLVCGATQAASEYGGAEPLEVRREQLVEAQRGFERVFGRKAASFCPPDYGWDHDIEAHAHSLGLRVLQGWAEQAGLSWLVRQLRRVRWPRRGGRLFAMPARIAFEPRGDAAANAPLGVRRTLHRVRAAWAAGRPAVVSSHRLNYAHLDAPWSEAGRTQLRALIAALVEERATFLTDAEVLDWQRGGWSLRPLGDERSLLRRRGDRGAPIRIPLPARATGAEVRRVGGDAIRPRPEEGAIVIDAPPGDYVVEWRGAVA